MDFLVYSRAAPGAADTDDDPALDEAHWSYMDRFADGMVARGPTFAADRETWTGSLHIVGLPDAGAAREFVEREPYHRAGLFGQHLVRRFDNKLGRTMWEFPGGSGDPRFLVLAHAPSAVSEPLLEAPGRDRLIVLGELSTPGEGRPAGVALALQAPTRRAVDELLDDRGTGLGGLDLEIVDWEFGGRR
jgi:uncharacterized protein YciI